MGYNHKLWNVYTGVSFYPALVFSFDINYDGVGNHLLVLVLDNMSIEHNLLDYIQGPIYQSFWKISRGQGSLPKERLTISFIPSHRRLLPSHTALLPIS